MRRRRRNPSEIRIHGRRLEWSEEHHGYIDPLDSPPPRGQPAWPGGDSGPIYRIKHFKRRRFRPHRWRIPRHRHYRRYRFPTKRRNMRIGKIVACSIIFVAVIWGVVTYGSAAWDAIRTWITRTPPNYYKVAENYVSMNYHAPTGDKNIAKLFIFLNQIEFRDYEGDVFDCSEATAMLEWLLEGAGFNAVIATNVRQGTLNLYGHSWVLVALDDGNTVAIEATSLTQNYYAPPGIIEAPDGRYREYSSDYLMFLDWKEMYPPYLYDYDPNITFEEWKQQYLIQFLMIGIPSREGYYNPTETFNSIGDAVPVSEYDWWNALPYNSTYPFSEWR